MEPMDSLLIEAGQVIHYHGIPVLLTENTRVMGRKENFKTKDGLPFIITNAADEAPVKA